ncbi:MAG: hypothetical protein K6G03_09135, partial [Lachnospiraceae bacterium]|nr:hypothetical protein [Lachnospiraceae bacterium]
MSEEHLKKQRTESPGPIVRGPVIADPLERTAPFTYEDRGTVAVDTAFRESIRQRQLMGRELKKTPILGSTVDMDAHVQLMLPDIQSIQSAYNETGLELSDSSWKRKKKVNESYGKYARQTQLEVNMQQQQAGAQIILDLKDAVKLSDEELVKHYQLYDKSDDYLRARYNLIRNRYYALLPESEIRDLKRPEILSRIRRLYEKQGPQRNEELIRYYQSLIIIMDEEAAVKEGTEETDTQVLLLPSKAELKKQNGEGFKRTEKVLDKMILSDAEKQKRKSVMKSVMMPESRQQAWGKDEPELDQNKREGIRSILAWMYRNCCKSSESKEPLVYKLASARPDQLLFMFYLIEKGRMEAPSTEECNTALTEYVPNVDKFKSKVVAAKWKFWKRIGTDHSDDVINWSLIGSASRYVLNCDAFDKYTESSGQVKRIQKALNPPAGQPKLKDVQKRDLMVDMVRAKGQMLLDMYRMAGLSPDMPPELIKDKKLRQKVIITFKEFQADTARLTGLINKTGVGDLNATKNATRHKVRPVGEAADGYEDEKSWVDVADDVDNVLFTAVYPDEFLSSLEGGITELTEKVGYGVSIGGIGIVASILGLISTCVEANSIRTG